MSETNGVDFNFKNTRLERIPLSKIRENADSLRKVVDKEDPKYQEGLDSVKKRGIMNPILVREIRDPATNELLYGLIDGLHRYNWSMDSGYQDIPASIGSLEESNLLEAQIMANVHKIETKAMQYTKALINLLSSNPLLTLDELAARISVGTQFLRDRLNLIKLSAPIQEMVDSGQLPLSNAYSLSKLPEDKQKELLQSALSKTFLEFGPQAKAVLAEVNQAKREGRKAETDEFKPTPRLQKHSAITDECDNCIMNPEQSALIAAARANGCKTMEDGVTYAMKWVLHLDPVSVANDKAKHEAEKAASKAAAEKRAQERQAKKSEAAAAVAATV